MFVFTASKIYTIIQYAFMSVIKWPKNDTTHSIGIRCIRVYWLICALDGTTGIISQTEPNENSHKADKVSIEQLLLTKHSYNA